MFPSDNFKNTKIIIEKLSQIIQESNSHFKMESLSLTELLSANLVELITETGISEFCRDKWEIFKDTRDKRKERRNIGNFTTLYTRIYIEVSKPIS